MVEIPASPVLQAFGPYTADPLNASKLGANNRRAVLVMDRAGWR